MMSWISLQKKVKLTKKITYGWKSVCKIYITYGILSTDLYSYVKSALHIELSTDSNPYINITYKFLYRDLHPGYYIQI